MTAGPRRGVVAGVDDSPSGPSVARAAATEAARRGLDLELVHAVDEWGALADPATEPALVRALAVLEPGAVHDRATPALLGGHPVDVLVHRSHDADLVVVGAGRRAGAWDRLLGSTARGVLRRATCAVLVVPPDAPDALEGGDGARTVDVSRGPVVAAVGLDGDTDAVIAAAAGYARRLQTGLRVVHSLLPGPYSSAFAPAPATWDDLEAHARTEISRALAAHAGGLAAAVTVAPQPATDLLSHTTREAALVVVGHRTHRRLVQPPHHLAYRPLVDHLRGPLLSVPVAEVAAPLEPAP